MRWANSQAVIRHYGQTVWTLSHYLIVHQRDSIRQTELEQSQLLAWSRMSPDTIL